MKTCRCWQKHNFGWARTKKPSRPTLKIFTETPNKKASSTEKKILLACVCNKNSAMSAEKYQSRLYNGRCRLLDFLFNPGIIFGCCLLGNFRSASSGDASFLNLNRSSFLADVGYYFFRSVSVNHVFLPRLANIFLAKQMKTCRCRQKHNFGWAQTKKPSRPTL